MKTITVTQYFSDDNKGFDSMSECLDYELKLKLEKNGLSEFSKKELTIGNGVAIVDHLPFVAPWMNGFGACLVKIFEVKKENDKVLFGVGNEAPPVLGWVEADDFYEEWPQ